VHVQLNDDSEANCDAKLGDAMILIMWEVVIRSKPTECTDASLLPMLNA